MIRAWCHAGSKFPIRALLFHRLRVFSTASSPNIQEPFLRDIFRLKVSQRIFEYPELGSIQEVELVTKLFDKAKHEGALVCKPLNSEVPRKNDFFAPIVPKIYGGLEWDFRQYLRFIELLAQTDVDSAISHSLMNANAFKILVLFGTNEQKNKFIMDSIIHSKIISLAYAEKDCGSDFSQNQTTAVFDSENKVFTLNGTKSWVPYGDQFLVAAKVESPNRAQTGNHSLFLVDDLTGVEITKNGYFNRVKFTNVIIPATSIIGRTGDAIQIVQTAQTYGRLAVSAVILGILRRALESLVKHTQTKTSFGRRLSEYGLIRKRISSLSQSIYSIESMLYHVGGLANDDLDFLMESQALKIYSTRQVLREIASICDILPENEEIVNLFRIATELCTMQGSNNLLSMSLALHGVENGRPNLVNVMKLLSNPFENVLTKIKFQMKALKVPYLKRNQTVELKISGFVHQSLREQADILELAILRLCAASLYVVQRKSLIDEQIFLDRISKLTIHVYRLFSCLTRSSRSLCIGLSTGSFEIAITRLIAVQVDIQVEAIILEVENDINKAIDDGIDHVTSKVLKDNGSVALHALTRQW